MELREKSGLLHPMDGGEFISHCNDDDEEIGCASLHNVATADNTYNVDYHNYDNVMPHPNHTSWVGDYAMFPHPQQRMIGNMKKRGEMTKPTASISKHLRVLPCKHTFQSNCIFPWLTERSPTCSLCKAMFEAVQREVNNVGEMDGAEMMTMTSESDQDTEDEDHLGALTL